jgi:hypothetical protein
VQAIKTVSDSRSVEQLNDAESHRSQVAPYDPGAIFLLEMMLSMAVRGSDAIEELWLVVPCVQSEVINTL